MHTRTVRSVLLLLVVCGLVAGCSASRFPIFDRPATTDDKLPEVFENFDADQLDRFDLRTARLAATYDGVGLYMIRTTEGLPCLAIASDAAPVIGCGGLEGEFGTSVADVGEFEVRPAPIDVIDGWEVLSDNIRVRSQ